MKNIIIISLLAAGVALAFYFGIFYKSKKKPEANKPACDRNKRPFTYADAVACGEGGVVTPQAVDKIKEALKNTFIGAAPGASVKVAGPQWQNKAALVEAGGRGAVGPQSWQGAPFI